MMGYSQIITFSIIAEVLTIDSEDEWFGYCNKNMSGLLQKVLYWV